MVNKDDPRVVELLKQLQEQYYNIGKISTAVAYANVRYLRTELYELGWNTRLLDDGKTVELYERTTGSE